MKGGRIKLFYLPQSKKENKNTVKLVALADEESVHPTRLQTPAPSFTSGSSGTGCAGGSD